MTITDAARQVLKQVGRPQTPAEIHAAIVEQSLFSFGAQSPVNVVRRQLRRHCEGVEAPDSSDKKYFRIKEGDRYELID